MSRTLWLYFLFAIIILSRNENSKTTGIATDNCNIEFTNMLNNFIQDPLSYIFLKDSGKGLNNLGNFNLCEVRNNTRFLSLYILNLPTVVTLGICLPNSCESKDLDKLKKPFAKFFTQILRSLSGDGSLDLTVKEESIFFLDQKEEKEKFQPFALGFYFTISFFIIMILICIISAFKVINNPKTIFDKIVKSFSLRDNFINFFSVTSREEENIKCLNGIRILGMCWVVLGHIFSGVTDTAALNPQAITSFFTKIEFSYIYNATYSVDIFFFLSAFLMTYLLLKQLRRSQGKINVFLIYIHRLIRLYPALLTALIVAMYIVPALGSGPIYTRCYWRTNICFQTWYHIVFFYNDFDSLANIVCMGHTWYLAMDTQFFILSPVIILIIYNYFLPGLIIILSIILLSFSIQYIVIYYYQISSAIVNYSTEYMDNYYVMPYCRVTPWMFGILIGYFYFKYRMKESEFMKNLENLLKRNWILKYFLNLLGLLGMAWIIIELGFMDKKGKDINRFFDVTYLTFSRFLFVVFLWISIFPTVLGFPNIITRILGLNIFNILAKPTYTIYLLHFVIITYFKDNVKAGIRLDYMYIHIDVLNYLVWSFVAATLCILFIEFPVFNLEKYFLMPERLNIAKELNEKRSINPFISISSDSSENK